MKTDIHPVMNPVVFVDLSSGTEFSALSTLTSAKTKKIDGVEHFVVNVDTSSASHPHYTGKKQLIDTAGRVDKFEAKRKKAAALAATKGGKKKKVEAAEEIPVEDAPVDES
jgi:large subunit ribosomal protein L31